MDLENLQVNGEHGWTAEITGSSIIFKKMDIIYEYQFSNMEPAMWTNAPYFSKTVLKIGVVLLPLFGTGTILIILYYTKKKRALSLLVNGEEHIVSGDLKNLEYIRDELSKKVRRKEEEIKEEKIIEKKGIMCPQCGSDDLYYEAGLITGYKYHCKDCDYIGAFVIET